ncbi:MAG: hypothetical protein ACM3OO_01180 [Planctomycetaceae bacterium]
MARAAARVEDLEAGRLPPVCAKTGQAADGYARIEFTSTPSWTWILLLFGIFPFLIARAFSKVRVVGIVPMSDAALRRGRTFDRAFAGLLVLAVVLVTVGLVADRPHLLMAGLVTLVGSLLFLVVGWSFVWPTGQPSGDWVWLTSVDEGFARALGRWYGGRGLAP